LVIQRRHCSILTESGDRREQKPIWCSRAARATEPARAPRVNASSAIEGLQKNHVRAARDARRWSEGDRAPTLLNG
jgi:hypothetical protein